MDLLSHPQFFPVVGTIIGLTIFGTWLRRLFFRKAGVFDLFNVPPMGYKLHSTDLGGEKPTLLRGYGISGAPDAVFVGKKRVIIGERKSRKVRSEQPSMYELYQVTLYMGLASKLFPNKTTSAKIKYANKVISVRYDDSLFRRLIGMRAELLESRKRGKAINRLPLHKR